MWVARLATIVLLTVCCRFPVIVFADHLPESEIARGRADTVLSAVNVYHSTMQQVIRKLGQPTSSRTIPDAKDIAGGKQYEWKTKEVRLVAVTWDEEKNSVPYSVEVWGAKPTGKLGITGRGLNLGATLNDVRRVYGIRFNTSRHDDGTIQLIVQWQDETTLYLYFDETGHVNHMHLIAAIE
jgi:hypothetical protein